MASYEIAMMVMVIAASQPLTRSRLIVGLMIYVLRRGDIFVVIRIVVMVRSGMVIQYQIAEGQMLMVLRRTLHMLNLVYR